MVGKERGGRRRGRNGEMVKEEAEEKGHGLRGGHGGGEKDEEEGKQCAYRIWITFHSPPLFLPLYSPPSRN